MNINISFKLDGTAHCLWTEALALYDLGRLQLTRVSQQWLGRGDEAQSSLSDSRGYFSAAG